MGISEKIRKLLWVARAKKTHTHAASAPKKNISLDDIRLSKSNPFFIIGCVRSGTTMLRNILRMHPNLDCPEETHFFRWADPYGSNRYNQIYEQNKVIKHQYALDGFSGSEISSLLNDCTSKKEISNAYGQIFLDKQGNPDGRWFDKTPQNVYGALLIHDAFPHAPFIHIHRHPLNVAASLAQGKVMPKHSVVGAVNYWNESMILMQYYKQLFPEQILEIKYEDFTNEPGLHVRKILGFIGEDEDGITLPEGYVKPELHRYEEVLSSEQIEFIRSRCSRFIEMYEYL